MELRKTGDATALTGYAMMMTGTYIRTISCCGLDQYY